MTDEKQLQLSQIRSKTREFRNQMRNSLVLLAKKEYNDAEIGGLQK